MNMATDPFSQLDVIREASAKGRVITDCYRLMFKRELWVKAYCRLAPNPGNLTKGTSNETIDGFSNRVIDELIGKLREGSFRFSAARRTHIPKRSGGKRPLGIPNFKEKLVQEVMRMIIENIYEPLFSPNSHGFRPKRGCHTALTQIKRTWRGLNWCVEGDIKGCFDNIDHQKLIRIIERKIKDKRFLLLLHSALKAGYLEDFQYHQTFSGTPQGGIVSPVLSNIYLNELDEFMRRLRKQFEKGQTRQRPERYVSLAAAITGRRKILRETDRLTGSTKWMGRERRVREIKHLRQHLRQLPSVEFMDPDYRRLRYVRYADDFVIGICGSKKDALRIKSQVKQFLETELGLELSETKTLISNLKERVKFLGYEFQKWQEQKVRHVQIEDRLPSPKRTLSGEIKLLIPRERLREYAQKNGYGNLESLRPIHRAKWLNNSELEILYTYNAELRGLANFYVLANNYHHLDRLFFLATWSFMKTLAAKRKSFVPKVSRELRRHDQGNYCLLRKDSNGEIKPAKLVQLKHLPPIDGVVIRDQLPNTAKYAAMSELERRLSANRCEACGDTNGPFEVHHIRKLKDLKKRRDLQVVDKIMIQRQRKTLILCYHCHHRHHERQIPIEQLESAVR